MLEPSQFEVNEAWLAFKLNDAPVVTGADGDFNVVALMDAASCFILGAEFILSDSIEPSQLESRRLLKAAQSHKQQFPEKLIISMDLTADNLIEEAERLGVTVVTAREEELSIFLHEARDGFREHGSGGSFQ